MDTERKFLGITIIKSKRDDLFYINSRPVIGGNWEISRFNFTTEEQKSFENYYDAIKKQRELDNSL